MFWLQKLDSFTLDKIYEYLHHDKMKTSLETIKAKRLRRCNRTQYHYS